MFGQDLDTDRRPLVLIWELTQACDLSCKHCRADAQSERHPAELSTREGKRLLDDASEFGEGQLVVLSGGDPLVRDDVVELIDYGVDQGLTMTMTPSGTESLDAPTVHRLGDAGLRRIAVSIDGPGPESHDDFRGENGSFEQTLRAAKAAADVGLPLQVNTTVSQETVRHLPAMAELVEELGAVLWSVFFLVPVGRGTVLTPISPEKAERVMEWLADLNRGTPFEIKTTEAPHYRRVLSKRRGASSPEAMSDDGIRRRMGITAGNGFAFVSHTGLVYPSGFLPKAAGSVREESVVDIYRDSPLFTSLREPDDLKGKCGVCPFRNVCGGSRSRAFAYTGDPLESDPLCAYVPPDYEGSRPVQTVSKVVE
ncbi:Radical SAM superfamily enzyme [Halanaeroarchaeum sp. HSR-CO]|uniref:TIGR04053 family radical SAM/SPASM domain-containing protein n=1 Tax=Halanaeroarchaeum sp. HSR-CO TaxID=2866382 RepID=UPI00217E42E9|nr:TIGR04053 family radical SAM/SPASM domain-containing protein [Halanaeroarchaeum sp. HSR-CO]UWG47952.1 Radical SAM superfamily enzyme [Halanaeroarchaeum sp. HSR-CO]